MSQRHNRAVVSGQLAQMPWDANGLADDDNDELRTVLEDARTVQAGHLGKSRPTAGPSLSRFPVGPSPHGDGHDHIRSRDNAEADLCETRQAQELGDDFFALYTSQADAVSPNDRSGRGGATPSSANASATVAGSHGDDDDDAASPNDQENEGADRDNDVDVPGEVRVGRADDHHAQQSQYVPECTEDLEEEDSIADSSESPVVSEQPVEGFRSEAQQPPSRSDSAPATERPWQPECWPHPHPPPFAALPRPRQTRVTFHTQRYGAFIKAYLGLSDAEVEQAQRRGRGICMIGVRKAPPSSSHLAASASYATPFSPPSSSSAAGAATGYTFQPMHRRHSHHGFGEPVKVQRTFLRHSVLAVEGDAVFSELIDRAEVLYAVEQHRLDAAWKTHAHDPGAAGEDAAAASATAVAGTPAQPPLYPQFRKLPRVTEPYLRPNARCIALHYGLPDRAASDSSDGSAGRMATDTAAVQPKEGEGEERKPRTHRTSSTPAPPNPYPRASLMAVVCTTRLEEGEEIYVSLESYYRCLDEVSWYRRCYSELNKRCGCPDGVLTPCTAAAEGGGGMKEATAGQDDLIGNVYTGVRRFPEWPADLAYYHGVGRRHASRVAEAAFPFTLVSLAPAPELGDDQKGVVASAWLPYGTCLLYCGPAVATRKVERLVSERALRGDSAVARTTTTAQYEAQTHPGGEEDDLSFVTDDTYALGLGRHGVCFGQGLTRYINHRYNTSRFGNVELCSVILSVPSEFASAHGTAAAPAGGPEELKSASERATTKSAGVDASSSLTAEERVQVARAATAKRPCHRRRVQRAKKGPPPPVAVASGAAAVPAAAVGDRLAALYAKPKRRPPRRRAPCLFLEERSFFVTVPFFLVTTDIPPGTSLLAWTYGEDYDAKLERQAVADGHVVPYADAVLLNRRLAASPAADCRLQRYNGDYRFAVGAGDVVWRRRPVRLGIPSSPVDCAGGHDIVDVCVPPPEEDLFVVVQTLRSSVERVLLRPLERVPLTSRQLGTLLREQHLDDYVSPHAPSNARLGPQKGRRRVGRPPSANSKRQRAAALTHDWAAHWAVFRLTDISALAPAPFAGTSSCLTLHALARYEEALRTCVVATTDSVGLLLMDIDYSAVHRTRDTGGESAAHRLILVNLDDLHHATSLVRTSPGRAAAVPALCNGLLWPLYCMVQRPRAAAAAAFSAADDVLRARPGSRV
ncbi:conserved hypothetical protein [Leishmania major strain Friedlin]|uniref:SET domain-containing protein n=1 Tax=Leishmania major TaxID=5664 RepID=Q9NF97_LEIMA|nr:conserved hypothetical protein [Leishmania major strain Friedlin]CAC22642.1 conserved hypothetical protein [Leishmania major strain Friedlin]CAG9567811.1 hypothetical_protein_-_conserved [Leishmania major strain Friedlin]|eukprot:XP_888609.1 conserved hypothetical protein [Leishmania major strain Friedlin]